MVGRTMLLVMAGILTVAFVQSAYGVPPRKPFLHVTRYTGERYGLDCRAMVVNGNAAARCAGRFAVTLSANAVTVIDQTTGKRWLNLRRKTLAPLRPPWGAISPLYDGGPLLYRSAGTACVGTAVVSAIDGVRCNDQAGYEFEYDHSGLVVNDLRYDSVLGWTFRSHACSTTGNTESNFLSGDETGRVVLCLPPSPTSSAQYLFSSGPNQDTIIVPKLHRLVKNLRIALKFAAGPTNITIDLNNQVTLVASSQGHQFGTGTGCDGQYTIFDDSASHYLTQGHPPYLGSYRPDENNISDLLNDHAGGSGRYQLYFSDSSGNELAPSSLPAFCWKVLLTPGP